MKREFCPEGKRLRIIVKPNSRKTDITGFDDVKKAWKVDVRAQPEKNKANIEIIKYFSRLLKKKVLIKSGISSKEKTLEIL